MVRSFHSFHICRYLSLPRTAEARWYELHDLPPMGKNAKAMLNLVLE